jgi:hypothetical protein
MFVVTEAETTAIRDLSKHGRTGLDGGHAVFCSS